MDKNVNVLFVIQVLEGGDEWEIYSARKYKTRLRAEQAMRQFNSNPLADKYVLRVVKSKA